MEACDVIRLFVNKALVCEQPKHAGNPGYGRLRSVRILAFARLKGLTNDTRIVEYLKKHKKDAAALGLMAVPDRTTVGRWWKRYLKLLEVFNKLSDMLQLLTPTTLLVVDSTPLGDLLDAEARWGKSSRGWFKGFKLHASVNEQGLPLRAKVTPANYYDSPILPQIVWDLKASYLLADAGYDSKLNHKVAKTIGAVAVIAKNPRKKGKDSKNQAQTRHSKLLSAKRYVVEQFNGHFKANLLKECYLKPKGLAKKSAMVYAALIGCDVEALRALLYDEISLKTVSKYWA